MHFSTLILSGLAAASFVDAQGIDFVAIISKRPVLAKATNTPTASINVNLVAASITAKLQNAKPTARVAASNCGSLSIPFGYTSNPDTPTGFLVDTKLSTLSKGAINYPAGYSTAFTAQYGAVGGSGLISTQSLSTYDAKACAALCNSKATCKSFNIYFERSPKLTPGSSCPNPASAADVRCALFSTAITAAQATNVGQWKVSFMDVIQGSNGYNKLATPAVISGFQTAVALAGAVDSSQNFVAADFFPTTAFDPQQCATFCTKTTAANKNAAQAARVRPYKACNYFNAVDLNLNGLTYGTYCQLYSSDASSMASLYTAVRSSTKYNLLKSAGYMISVVDSGQLPAFSSTTKSTTKSTTASSTLAKSTTKSTTTTTKSTTKSTTKATVATTKVITTPNGSVGLPTKSSTSTSKTFSSTTKPTTTTTTTTTTTRTTTTTTIRTTRSRSGPAYVTATNGPDRHNFDDTPGIETDHFNIHGMNADQAKFIGPYLETAFTCFIDDLGWRSPGLGNEGRNPGIYFKTNVYSVQGLDNAWMSVDDTNLLAYINLDSSWGPGDAQTHVHEYGHGVHYHQETWVGQARTGAWWETMANWIASTTYSSPLCADARATFGIEQTASAYDVPMHLDKLISQSYQVIVDGTAGSGNYYEAWPILTYVTNNPDNFPSLGSDTVRQMMVQYAANSNEDPIQTLDRVAGETAVQEVIGRYWARMAFVDIGHAPGYQKFIDEQGNQDIINYPNLDYVRDGLWRVKQERRPCYMGSNMIKVNDAKGDVQITVTSDSGFTATAAIRAVNNGPVRYVTLAENEENTVTVADGEQLIVVVANTPDELIPYNGFELKDSPASVGLDYTIAIDGGWAADY